MDDYTRQEAGYRAALLRQQELGGVATGLGLEQAGFATQQRQIGINRPINKPDFLTSALSTATSAVGAYGAGLQMQQMGGGFGGAGGAGAGGSGPFNVIQTGDAPMPGLAGSRYMYSVN
jgi:hypothetical protein